MVCIDVAVPGTDAVGDYHSLMRVQNRPDDRGIAGAIVFLPDQGLDHTPSLNLMIVLADDGFLAANVEPGEHLLECLRQVVGHGQLGLFEAFGFPRGLQPHLGESPVQKIHIQISDGPSTVEHMEFASVGEHPQNGGLNIHLLG